jgi:hypothetical protein
MRFQISITLLLALFTLPFLSSCNLDDGTDVDPEEGLPAIDIGSYSLLPESIAQIPYVNQSGIIFVDTFGTEVFFSIEEEDIFESSAANYYKYDVFEEGDTVVYEFNTEIKTFNLVSTALGMQFRLRLRAMPYYGDPESEAVADIMEISLPFLNSPNFSSQIVFRHEVDTRSYPTSFNNEPIPEIEIFDRAFTEVIWNDYTNPISQVYFNFEHGIVSFTDYQGKQWRFEDFQ